MSATEPSRPVIIAVAPCGARAMKRDNPAMPYTPAEIAAEILRAVDAGAALAHVHARRPDGAPTQNVDAFREIVQRVRERSDVIIEISLGTKGFTAEQAMEPLVLRPGGATLPYEGYEESNEAGVGIIRNMAETMVKAGVRPGLGVLSQRTLNGALTLMKEGLAGPKPCVAVSVDPFEDIYDGSQRLVDLTRPLPQHCHWWLMKGGSHQVTLRALALGLGGHVRVGFEDTVNEYDRAMPASSNAYFVEHMARLAKALGRPVATVQQAREMLELGGDKQ